MKRLIATLAVRAARKNPRAAVGVLLFTARHARGIAKGLRATRRASHVVSRAKAAEPVVQRELRASAASLAGAVARAKKIGLLEAVGDKQVAKHLDGAMRHAADAFGGVRKARRSHGLRAALGGTAPLIAVYGAWRLKSRD